MHPDQEPKEGMGGLKLLEVTATFWERAATYESGIAALFFLRHRDPRIVRIKKFHSLKFFKCFLAKVFFVDNPVMGLSREISGMSHAQSNRATAAARSPTTAISSKSSKGKARTHP
jgi:hypothetical protein